MIVLAVGLLYPLLYDGTQMIKQGFDYYLDAWNYLDLLNVFLGYGNLYLQWKHGTWYIWSKVSMIVIILVVLMKTFFFMRIRMSFSYIVTMIINVVYDLKVFMIFFTILIVMFSAIFDVIARNNGAVYQQLHPFMGNVMATLRLSLGDFDFDIVGENSKLTREQHWLFWFIWVLMVIFSSLIFLNFIIAEVSNSYQNVKENIDALIYKERAKLVMEAEDFMSNKTRNNDSTKFPNYIIVREMEI